LKRLPGRRRRCPGEFCAEPMPLTCGNSQLIENDMQFIRSHVRERKSSADWTLFTAALVED
jgi:hypothetical protein